MHFLIEQHGDGKLLDSALRQDGVLHAVAGLIIRRSRFCASSPPPVPAGSAPASGRFEAVPGTPPAHYDVVRRLGDVFGLLRGHHHRMRRIEIFFALLSAGQIAFGRNCGAKTARAHQRFQASNSASRSRSCSTVLPVFERGFRCLGLRGRLTSRMALRPVQQVAAHIENRNAFPAPGLRRRSRPGA